MKVLYPMQQTITKFKKTVWNYYRTHGRHNLAWRHDTSPYSIVVSEIMLQQTQVTRVMTKYTSFMKKFPNWKKLAQATVSEVLGEWKGLGYNRRGLALHNIAKIVTETYKGTLPQDLEQLEALPHIGPNTARSISAFAFNIPVTFIETNVRTVFIHHFFRDKKEVHDKVLMPLIEKTADHTHPREWYWALMDYGSHLKQTLGNLSRQSKHYKKQSAFKGSNREFRSKLLTLIHEKPRTEHELEKTFHESFDKEALMKNLQDMKREGFIKNERKMWKIV
jgi:A/G-specific adenine glycosylase